MKEQPRRRLGLHTLDADTTSWVDVKSELLNGKHTRFALRGFGELAMRPP